MINIFKRNKTPESTPSTDSTQPTEKLGFFARLKQGLSKTRTALTDSLSQLILGKKTLDAELLELIETQLITADVGVEATQQLINQLTAELARNTLKDSEAVLSALQTSMKAILKPCQQPLTLAHHSPYVILVVGINGSGKTTTIGKLA